jgi:hypothetical protein
LVSLIVWYLTSLSILLQGSVVALIRSSVSISRSCFQGGSSEFLVFIANDATFEVSENYVDNFVSDRCQGTGPRLFQEDETSGCFLGSSTCEGTCLVLADQATCRAQELPPAAPVVLAPTIAPLPTVSQTASPSNRPSISPVDVTTPSVSPIMLESMFPTFGPVPNQSMVPAGNPTPKLPTSTLPPQESQSPNSSSMPTSAPSTSTRPSLSSSPARIDSTAPSLVPFNVGPKKPPDKEDSKKGKGMNMNSKKDMCMGMKMGKGGTNKDCKRGKGNSGMGKGGMSSSKGGGKGVQNSTEPSYVISSTPSVQPPSLLSPVVTISLVPSLQEAPQPPTGKGKGMGKGKGGGNANATELYRWNTTLDNVNATTTISTTAFPSEVIDHVSNNVEAATGITSDTRSDAYADVKLTVGIMSDTRSDAYADVKLTVIPGEEDDDGNDVRIVEDNPGGRRRRRIQYQQYNHDDDQDK